MTDVTIAARLHGGRFAMAGPAAAFVVMLVVIACGCEMVPKVETTDENLNFMRQGVLKFARENNTLPPNLDAVPPYLFEVNDAWGHPIQYKINGDGTVTLTSLGSDGKPGGKGNAEDITRRFRARTKTALGSAACKKPGCRRSG